jgi:predicted tellurium resistance membrane protein TerC
VLVFVGIKMLAARFVHLPPLVSLLIIATFIGTAVAFSLTRRARERASSPAP